MRRRAARRSAWQLREFTVRNYIEGPGGGPVFRRRHALNYGIVAAQPLVNSGDQIFRGSHAPRVCRYDHVRRLVSRADCNPVRQLEPWNPDSGPVVLWLARPVFAEIRVWTEGIVDGRFDRLVDVTASVTDSKHACCTTWERQKSLRLCANSAMAVWHAKILMSNCCVC
jgi:hypothetical protein